MDSGNCETRLERQDQNATTPFAHAIDSYLGHRGDLASHLDATLAADPDHIGAHCLRGFARLLLGRAALIPAARASLAAARASIARHGAAPRERDLTRALAHWCGGEMEASVAVLEAMLDRTPCDALAVKLDHALRFMLGDTAGMRRATEKVLPRWDCDAPHHGFILGCHAFALEESGALVEAERAAKQALEREPRDVWACHALAHVYEAGNTPTHGIALLAAQAPRWGGINNFARHLFWHWALFYLARVETHRALALYDSRIRETPTDDYRDIANAVSLLLRFEARGIDVAPRWSELADLAETHGGDHALAFAALHDLIALVHDGRMLGARRLLAAMENGVETGGGTQARVLAAIGLPLARHIVAPRACRAEPRLAAAVAQLGGSRVQRKTFLGFLDAAAAEIAAATMRAACA